MKAVILGGGFAGTTTAHLLKREGWDVTIVEREPYLGGGCRTFYHCGHPFTYGPRLYYGYSAKVFEWVDSFVQIKRFPFELRTLAHEAVDRDRRFWTYPIHDSDLPFYPRKMQISRELLGRDNSEEPRDFEEYWIQRVGQTLYEMFVKHYSKKMWMIPDNRIFDIFKWSAKDKPIEQGSREAYKGSYIGYPMRMHGYNHYFDAMTEGVNVVYGQALNRWDAAPGAKDADVVVSTIPIDEALGYELGELPYVGRDFHLLVLPCRQVFPGDVRFCHYASADDEWTRVTEFKKITYHESESTLLVLEKPSKNGRLYPYLTKANQAKVAEYQKLLPPNVKSIGRLGTYKYSTIEQTIIQAFECVAQITGKHNEMEGEWRGIGDVAMMKNRKE